MQEKAAMSLQHRTTEWFLCTLEGSEDEAEGAATDEHWTMDPRKPKEKPLLS